MPALGPRRSCSSPLHVKQPTSASSISGGSSTLRDPPTFVLTASATTVHPTGDFPLYQSLFAAQQRDTSYLSVVRSFPYRHSRDSLPFESPRPPSRSMTPPRSAGSAPRSNRSQDGPLSLQPLPRSAPPIRPQPPAHSSHHRSPSPSRFPRAEEPSVNEKSRSDGVVAQTPPSKAEASTSWDAAPESLSLHRQSCPSSEASLRHLTHQNCTSPDYLLSPISDTRSSHFALPLPSLHSGYLHPPRKIRLWSILRPWLPVFAYLSTSLGFLVATAFWKTQVFEGAFY